MKGNSIVNISEFTSQVIRYLDVFQDYCKTYDFDLFCDKYIENPSITSLESSTKVREDLINYFVPLKEDLLTYQYDYYNSKSVEDIATKIAVNPDRVLAYLERNKESYTKDQIKGLSEFGDVTLKTEVKDISSYSILKELQLVDRKLMLSKNTKARKLAES